MSLKFYIQVRKECSATSQDSVTGTSVVTIAIEVFVGDQQQNSNQRGGRNTALIRCIARLEQRLFGINFSYFSCNVFR